MVKNKHIVIGLITMGLIFLGIGLFTYPSTENGEEICIPKLDASKWYRYTTPENVDTDEYVLNTVVWPDGAVGSIYRYNSLINQWIEITTINSEKWKPDTIYSIYSSEEFCFVVPIK